jgi:hypothetical protein
MAPRFAPRTIPPLAANIKLNAINTLRQGYNYAPVNSVPPAQVTLTPAAPAMGGQNYLGVQGSYDTQPGWASISFVYPEDQMIIYLAAALGKTYLLDVSVAGTQNWNYAVSTGEPLTVTAQQGHLLIPFIATNLKVYVSLGPARGGTGSFVSAELTQVG